jgi:hypothetical protein
MITQKTVFVLGAGASHPYKFPIGWQLVRDVVGLFDKTDSNRKALFDAAECSADEYDEFIRVLRGSAPSSVDVFLEKQKKFLKIDFVACYGLCASLRWGAIRCWRRVIKARSRYYQNQISNSNVPIPRVT